MTFMKKTSITRAANALGYVLLRQTNHLIWKHPDTGAVVVTPKTTSDHRTLKNAQRYLLRGAQLA